jgi:hypothetical protein
VRPGNGRPDVTDFPGGRAAERGGMVTQWQYALVKRVVVRDQPVDGDNKVVPHKAKWSILYVIISPDGRGPQEWEQETSDPTVEFVGFLNARGKDGWEYWKDLPADPDTNVYLTQRKRTVWRSTSTSSFWLRRSITVS